jgi:hypothetical protein
VGIGPSSSEGSVADATGSLACVPRMTIPVARPTNQLPKFDRFIRKHPAPKTEANGSPRLVESFDGDESISATQLVAIGRSIDPSRR